MFAVTAQPQQFCHDELRAVAGARLGDRAADNVQARGQISGVHGMGSNAVAYPLVREACAGELPFGGRGISVLIVGHDDDERQFFDGGLVEGFVKGAGGGGPIAQARCADGAGNFFETPREQHAVHHGNHRAEVADHRQITFARMAAMDVAITSAHRSKRGAEIVADGVNNRFAKSQPPGGVADERGEHVGFFEGNAEGGAQGFLPATEKNAAVNLAGAVKRGKFVVQQPRPHHEAESGEVRLTDGIG